MNCRLPFNRGTARLLTPVQRQAREMISEIGINYRRSPIVGESWASADLEPGFSAGPTAGDRAPDGTDQTLSAVLISGMMIGPLVPAAPS